MITWRCFDHGWTAAAREMAMALPLESTMVWATMPRVAPGARPCLPRV
jgi:hypothetical protein